GDQSERSPLETALEAVDDVVDRAQQESHHGAIARSGRASLLVQRQRDAYRESTTGAIGRDDAAAVHFDDPPRDRQAEPGAGVVGREIGLEDAVHVLGANSRTAIRN